EPTFKDARNKYTTTTEAYLKLFEGQNEKVLGESSTPYLYFHEKTIKNIKELVFDSQKIKIIIILRDPADRAYSQYMHMRRDLQEELSFEEAILAEKKRMQENYHFDYFYVDKGFYYKQVKAYLDNFDHVKIVFYNQLENNQQKLLDEIYTFLEVDAGLNKDELKQRNQSGEMKVKWFKQIITTRKNPVLNFFRKLMSRETKKRLRNSVKGMLLKYNLQKTEIPKEARKQLINIYKEDIQKLSELIQKDLSDWLV
ncbi:MAG: sulfotransferase domain-containing protein, partial [Fimbriimonadaceae bacterium]|nr:sulfotransferase domain-containing protein [Chitinophagales bacterium]